MDMIPRQDFYIYMFYRNGTPFYVGKGKGPRMNWHENCARRSETCRHRVCRVIRKEWREGRQIGKEKICEGVSEPTAFRVERLMISIGRANNWPLVNLTDGGDGISGFHYTEAQRRSMWQYESSENLPQGVREYRRQRALQQWSNPQQREKRSQQGIERYTNPQEIERNRQIGKTLWEDPAYREKMTGRYIPSVLERMSKARVEGSPNHVGTFEGFISPQGVIYAPVINLTAFCKEHGLSYCGMWLVAKGKQATHKGWTILH